MIVVDSGSIISLAINCLCPLLDLLKGDFVITPHVYQEIVLDPSANRRFMLEAMRIRRLIDSGALDVKELRTDVGERILESANSIYQVHGHPFNIIHEAEAHVVGLAKEMGADAMMIDERTLRMLLEDPDGLKELLEHRNHKKVIMDPDALIRFQGILPEIPVIRSSELVAIAYEMGQLTLMHDVDDKNVLEAALSALKYSGCAITWEEIDRYLMEEI